MRHPVPQGFSTVRITASTPADEDKKELWDLFGQVAEAHEQYKDAIDKVRSAESELRSARGARNVAGHKLGQLMEKLNQAIGAPENDTEVE